MQIDVHASDHPSVPYEYDVCIERLPKALADAARAGIAAQTLPHAIGPDQTIWTAFVDLLVCVGQGCRLGDPASAFYIPSEAQREIVYSSALIDITDPNLDEHGRRALDGARRIATTLDQLRKSLPPYPYNLRVGWAEDLDLPLATLIKAGQLDAYPGGHCWWVREADAITLVPPGESLDDPRSPWFVSAHDRADHETVIRLSAAHRRHWPEIYGPAPTPRVR